MSSACYHRFFPRRLVLAGLFALVAVSGAQADRIVAVRSVVDHAYAARRANEPDRVETYVFAQGQYFNAIPMDRTLERMEFRTIATTLAVDLQKQRYAPAASVLAADLVLVVHWGVTQENQTAAGSFLNDYDLVREASNAVTEARERRESPETGRQLGVDQAYVEAQADFRRVALVSLNDHARSGTEVATNVELLGLQSSLDEADGALFGRALGDTLRYMVNEERYFVIVMAYDGPALREGRKKRLWTTRASIRAAGVNFAIALDRVSAAAASFHGAPSRGLNFETTRDRKIQRGEVNVGELTVMGESSGAPAPKGKR